MRCGFNLVEILMGFLILMLGLVSLQGLFFGTGLPYVMKARDQAIAVNFCERFLNIAKAELLLSPDPLIGETDLGKEIAQSETLQRSLESAGNMFAVTVRRVIAPCPPSTRLFRLAVTMQWSDRLQGGRVETVSLSTMVCTPEVR